MISNFIKAVINGSEKEIVKRVFVRYSVGDFEKEDFVVKIGGKDVTLYGGFEWVNFLQNFLAEISQGDVTISGGIEGHEDISNELDEMGISYNSKSRGMKGGFKFEISKQDVNADVYRQLVDKFWGYYLMLNCESDQGKIKLKGKSTPKIGKPTEKFVTLKVNKEFLDKVRSEYLFDADGDFKEAVVKHTYHVKDVKIDMKLVEVDANRARKEASRVGDIERVVTVDGKECVNKTIDLES